MRLAYLDHASSYYAKDGQPTKELACIKEALRRLRRLYGSTPAQDFGPKSLTLLRQHMIQEGLSRGVINQHVGRMKRFFRWAVAEELVPPSIYHGLQAVAGLRYGRCEARETAPVKPASDSDVDATLPFTSPPVAAMIQIQRLTGMRPSEVTKMRGCDIDRSGPVWVYEPGDHKNRWRGHRRLIPLGPKAQQVRDAEAARLACERLGLSQPTIGTARLFSGEAVGLLIALPGWRYPVVFDLVQGTARYDNFEQRWGETSQLERFLQRYAAEKVKLEARRRGHAVAEQQLADGSLKLTIQAGG